jgi:hypothetical protein
MLQGLLAGMSRKLLESGDAAKELPEIRRELVVMSCAYLESCAARALALPLGAMDGVSDSGRTVARRVVT